MCTLLLAHRVRADLPLVVAANRDENYARASTPPQLLSQAPRVLAGLDGRHAGSWMGVGEGGLFVGVTNQRTLHLPDANLRSRGAVVLEALRQGSVAGVERYLATLDPQAYNPFNLAFGDGESLRIAYARPEGIEVVSLEPGLHVLANDRLDSPHFPKTRRAAALATPLLQAPWEELARGLQSVLADHVLPPRAAVPPPPRGAVMPRAFLRRLQALCIHTPLYGTHSSTLLALAPGGRLAHYLFAPGPPCRTPFDDVTALWTGESPGAASTAP
jgi:uncharacterized protein with NRDE domain